MKVDVSNWKPNQNNTLRGFIAIKIGAMTVYDCQVHQKDNNYWVNYPSKKYTDNGQPKYFELVKFEKEVKEKIRVAVIELMKKKGFLTDGYNLPDDDLPF